MRPSFLHSHYMTALSEAHHDIEHLPCSSTRIGEGKDCRRAGPGGTTCHRKHYGVSSGVTAEFSGYRAWKPIEGISSSASYERVYGSAIGRV